MQNPEHCKRHHRKRNECQNKSPNSYPTELCLTLVNRKMLILYQSFIKTKKSYEPQAVGLPRVIFKKLSKGLWAYWDMAALLYGTLIVKHQAVSQLLFSILHENNQSLIFLLKDSVQTLGCGLFWKQATALPVKPVPICINKLKMPCIRRGHKTKRNSRLFLIAEGSPEMIVCSVLWVLHVRHWLRRHNLLTSPRNACMFCNENWLTVLPSSRCILSYIRVMLLSSPANLGFSSTQWHSFSRKNEKCSSSIPQSSLWLCG